MFLFSFSFNAPTTTGIYTLSLHDALPISPAGRRFPLRDGPARPGARPVPGRRRSRRADRPRSEEHTSELQSRGQLVCRLLLEKKTEGVGAAVGLGFGFKVIGA